MTTPKDPREREAAVTADVRDEVARRLDAVEREEGVRVLYACESGSRAWGFASPNRDYDVRFVYAHRPDWYLSIADRRDVIERPIVDELDLSGWELGKALRLFRKSNPPLIERSGSRSSGATHLHPQSMSAPVAGQARNRLAVDETIGALVPLAFVGVVVDGDP